MDPETRPAETVRSSENDAVEHMQNAGHRSSVKSLKITEFSMKFTVFGHTL